MLLTATGFRVDSADFDGSNDYMTRGADFTGNADSKTGIFSCWIRKDGGDGTVQRIISALTTQSRIFWSAGNDIQFLFLNAAGASILNMETTTARTASATWLHVLASWDLAVTTAHLYINDVDDKTETTVTDDTIDYTRTDWAIGAATDGTSKLDGCLAEFYFAPGQYLDFSVEANRRKFISASGKPVNLGTTGSLPTGTAPIAYQHLDDGEAVANFATNRGTGGDLTITGTLTTGSTSPSD